MKLQELHLDSKLIQNLFPTNLPYKLYEFDGSKFEKMDVSSDDKTEFYEHSEYYYDDKKQRRKAAKMFYKLVVNNKTYRIEIRFKGNAWAGAPQFQTHYENNQKLHSNNKCGTLHSFFIFHLYRLHTYRYSSRSSRSVYHYTIIYFRILDNIKFT